MESPSPAPVRYGVLPAHEVAAVSGLAFLQGMIDGRYPAPPIAEVAGMRMARVAEGLIEFEAVPTQAFMNPLPPGTAVLLP